MARKDKIQKLKAEEKEGHRHHRRGGLRTYFLAGILVSAPIGITFWLTWKLITFIDDRVTPLIPPRWNPETYLPFGVPGLGVIVAGLALILIGALAAGYLGRTFTRLSDRLAHSVPVVRSVYSWTKQLLETVLSQKSSAFREVVLVEYPSRGVWAVGFITGRTEGEVQQITSETVYNVFVPATPNVSTGFLLFVPEADVHHLDMSIEDGIKLVISGGIVEPPSAEERARRKALAAQEEAEEQARQRRGGGLSLLRRLRNYFFAGILVTAPIAITVWLAWEVINFIDDRVTPLIPPVWNPETYLPFSIPGLGVLVAVAGLTMIGFLTAGLMGRTIVALGERLLNTMPVVRSIYAAAKQVVETIFKEQSKAFRKVVLIQYPRADCWAIGFITGQIGGEIQRDTTEPVVNVFLPTTPNPTSGFLLFVPEGETYELAMSVEEGVKMVVSGGIVTPKAPPAAKPLVEKKGAEVA